MPSFVEISIARAKAAADQAKQIAATVAQTNKQPVSAMQWATGITRENFADGSWRLVNSSGSVIESGLIGTTPTTKPASYNDEGQIVSEPPTIVPYNPPTPPVAYQPQGMSMGKKIAIGVGVGGALTALAVVLSKKKGR